jgi:hypothetical protein
MNLPETDWKVTNLARVEDNDHWKWLVVYRRYVSDLVAKRGSSDERIAIRNGAWSIARETSLGIDVWRGLPFE